MSRHRKTNHDVTIILVASLLIAISALVVWLAPVYFFPFGVGNYTQWYSKP
jgi:hypothetical protein